MNRYNTGLQYNTGARYNTIAGIEYTFPFYESPFYERLPYAKPVILDQRGRKLAVLENAYDIVLEQEINGTDVLTFSLPSDDVNKQFLEAENAVLLVNAKYIIRRISEKRDASQRDIKVYCEAEWYDIMYADPLTKFSWQDADAKTVMQDILEDTGWGVGDVEIDKKRSLSVSTQANRLDVLHQVAEVWGGELEFDTANKVVHLRKEISRRPGVLFSYRKNIKGIEKVVDTTELVTRLYAYGKNGITFAEINGGKPYVENYQYTNVVRAAVFTDERFTNPYHLKERTEEILAMVSKPRVSYVVRAADLSGLPGYKHESFKLGDYVLVSDEEMGIQFETRIVKWQYYVDQPWKTTLELSNKVPTLANLIDSIQATSQALQLADTVDRSELREMMVFNYLLNSRAENGFAYWVNNGWEIDSTRGYSGTSSFRVRGQLGVAKTLSQTVWPAHRDNYTLSFRIDIGDVSRGPNAKIGVAVKFTYDDGTEDERYVSLI